MKYFKGEKLEKSLLVLKTYSGEKLHSWELCEFRCSTMISVRILSYTWLSVVVQLCSVENG